MRGEIALKQHHRISRRPGAFLLGMAIFVFLLIPLSNAQIERLRVVIDQDYPPFFYLDEKGEYAGASVDFWRLWKEKTGIAVELVPLEWEKAHIVMQEHEADVIDTVFRTPERELYLDFVAPLFPMTSSIYHRRGLSISTLADLMPYAVGAKSRDALVEFVRSQNFLLQFRLYPNYSDIAIAAKRGEIDCFLMDDLPANYYLVKHDLLAEFSRTPLPVLNHLYLATWKGNTVVAEILKEGLAKFSPEEIEGLLEQYTVSIRAYPPWLRKVVISLILGGALTVGVLLIFNWMLRKKVAKATAELLAKNQALKEAEKKLSRAIEIVASLPLFSVKEEEFLSRVLDLALEVIPKARFGNALLMEKNGRGRIVAIRGHREDLVGFTFEPEDLLVKERAEIVRDILNPKRRFSSREQFAKLVEASQPVAETLIAPLIWNRNLFGQIALDIPRGTNDHFDENDLALIERFAQICVTFHALRDYAQKEGRLLEGLLLSLAKALEYYDGSTRIHSEASSSYASEIARLLGLDEERARRVRWAALVHDVGKIFVPQEILRKPAKLTPEEYNLVKYHALKGEELLLSVQGLEDIAHIVRYHHERFDGTGYPDGLRGEDIPLESRIVAVVDAFEAMTSDRPYRGAMSVEEALEELKRSSGTQFDPRVVEAMAIVVKGQVEYTGAQVQNSKPLGSSD